MNLRTRGFTITELIIVITVISILVAIASIGWSNVVTWSRDNARENDINQWMGVFELYKGRYQVYPVVLAADGSDSFCLGTFADTSNRCGQYTQSPGTRTISDSDSTNMLSEIGEVGNIPENSSPTVNNLLAGPIVDFTQSTSGGVVTATAKFINFFQGGCPSGFTSEPSISYLAGLPANTAYACTKTKQFTYTPQ